MPTEACSDQIMVGRTGFSINRFDYGISEERGRRKTMEDHTVVIQDLGTRRHVKEPRGEISSHPSHHSA